MRLNDSLIHVNLLARCTLVMFLCSGHDASQQLASNVQMAHSGMPWVSLALGLLKKPYVARDRNFATARCDQDVLTKELRQLLGLQVEQATPTLLCSETSWSCLERHSSLTTPPTRPTRRHGALQAETSTKTVPASPCTRCSSSFGCNDRLPHLVLPEARTEQQDCDVHSCV